MSAARQEVGGRSGGVRMSHLTAALVAVGVLAGVTGSRAQPAGVALHVGHILDAFKGTPGDQGLLPTAVAEAKIAQQHAALAAKAPDNLEAMKLHAGHIINAIDPAVEPKGPGQGYGVKKAAVGVAQHADLIARAGDASKHVQSQATYVAAWANNVVKWSDEIVDLAKRIQTATSASSAAGLVTELSQLVDQLFTGVEGVGRFQAQGGLQQAQERMDLLKKGDGKN